MSESGGCNPISVIHQSFASRSLETQKDDCWDAWPGADRPHGI